MPPSLPALVSAAGRGKLRLLLAAVSILVVFGGSSAATESGDGFALLRKGETAAALTEAEAALKESPSEADWLRLKIECLLATGRYDEAREAVKPALEAEPRDLPLLWTCREALRAGGRPKEADELPERIENLMVTRDWAYRDAASIVIYGRALLARGTDPKQVLDKVYSAARKVDAAARDSYLARGFLAIEKGDDALAAKAFQEGLKFSENDPDMHYGLAMAFAGSDRKAMSEALDKALAANPRHIPSLLLNAEFLIDREDYSGAATVLERVSETNPAHPSMWALRAVIAHLQNDKKAESDALAAALKPWPGNPEPHHLYGRKLSRKYRFAEGAAAQRRALASDPRHLPAKAQLASDLLRLGEETEGWKAAAEVNDADAYNVTVHNLLTLHDSMESGFTTLENGDFQVRMERAEAAIYGPMVLDLLSEARRKLGSKYGIDIRRPTIVEIFTRQNDFGVRTFGMPDNPGYLGVCFGRVVTANSPAANTHPVNWQAVLWHEFCHTVTLQATKNRMPRWLSEGISVFEERQADPSWGERMSGRYRAMILGDDLTPVGALSGAFLSPKSPEHLLFAYFESSLVVEFIVSRSGLDALRSILNDLAGSTTINDSLARRVAPLEKLEAEFRAFARAKAEAFAPGVDWNKPDAELLLAEKSEALAAWSQDHPHNYWMLMRDASRLIDEEKWQDAAAALQKILALHPDADGRDGALALLATAQKELGDRNGERTSLLRLAGIDSAVPDTNARLVQLGTEAADWKLVGAQAARWLAVNPLIPAPWRAKAAAAEATGDWPAAAAAWRAILAMDPPDPSETHYRLARALNHKGDPAAKRHVLMALEDNPRHREALRLLLELRKDPKSSTPP